MNLDTIVLTDAKTPKATMLYDSIYKKHPKQAYPQGQKAGQWLPRGWGRGMESDCSWGQGLLLR